MMVDIQISRNGNHRFPTFKFNHSHFEWGNGSTNDLLVFDGTIFTQDTGHILFDAHGCGSQRREVLDEQIKTGERSFREVSEEMWGSLNVPFEDGFEVMEKTLEIDPDFHVFHKFRTRSPSTLSLLASSQF
jgi:2-hydroxy-3-keto-5-methylthiopentenyl-1-phosphate phosphatase